MIDIKYDNVLCHSERYTELVYIENVVKVRAALCHFERRMSEKSLKPPLFRVASGNQGESDMPIKLEFELTHSRISPWRSK